MTQQRFPWARAVACCLLAAALAHGQQRKAGGGFAYPPKMDGAKAEVYKTVGDVTLSIFIFEPPGHRAEDKRPAIVFFFGGGWTSGSPAQFEQQCRHLASRGMVAMTADYRVASRHQVKAVECVKDAKSAVRWVRANAKRLGVDPDRIAAGGGSAGGHIAACTAVIEGLDEPAEDARVSSKPNALVLFNPAMALAPLGEKPLADKGAAQIIAQRVGADARTISPAHHVKAGVPPTIMFFGTQDRLLEGAQFFQRKAREAGSRCELITYEGQSHGFFNYGRGNNEFFRKTVEAMERFLESLGCLGGKH